jgi:capsular polysaccharide export protein
MYIEPHPVRDSYEEFSGIGRFLVESMLAYKNVEDFELRVFSNNSVIDILNLAIPSVGFICERPTGVESKRLESYKSAWREDTIQTWIDLTNGIGEVAQFYYSMLQRIHSHFKFDAVVLWSENGAVRNFCSENDIIALHGELGPTRAPFQETMYFDPAGTNGNAAARRASLPQLDVRDLPPATWLGMKSREENNPEGIGIIDTPYTAVIDTLALQIQHPYVYIPLQLADDLNTIKNSTFKGPKDFLEQVLPKFIAQGFNIVIKPHPGSIHRPYNLISETKALSYAKSLGEKICILDRSTTVTRALRLISQAAYVCTINSSVGYEALLLGKTPIVLGDAYYDVGGLLKLSLDEISNLASVDWKNKEITKLVNFVSGHLLIDKASVATGQPIIHILKFLSNSKRRKTTSDNVQFWKDWIANIKYGIEWIGNSQPDDSEIQAGSIFGDIDLLAARSRKFEIEGSQVTIKSLGPNGVTLRKGTAKTLHPYFISHIDVVDSTTKKELVKISGWTVDLNMRPPAAVIIIEDDNIVSVHRALVQRQDTVDFIKANIRNAGECAIHPTCGFSFESPIKNISNSKIMFLSADNIASIGLLKPGLFSPII